MPDIRRLTLSSDIRERIPNQNLTQRAANPDPGGKVDKGVVHGGGRASESGPGNSTTTQQPQQGEKK